MVLSYCSTAFYKEFNEDYSCIRIVSGKDGGAKPNVCIQCGKCMKACPQHIRIPDMLETAHREISEACLTK